MTTPPPGKAGWEQRLENLARAQERVDGLREALARTLSTWVIGNMPENSWLCADALIAGPLAPLLEAQAAVQRVEALAKSWERGRHNLTAALVRAAIDGNMPVRPLSGALRDEQARTGVRGSGRCGATEGDGL